MAMKQGSVVATHADAAVTSAALRRLTDEVSAGTVALGTGYNRTHNRHNR